jgi:tetratricopeptide (TPR) repeat protein
MSGAEAASRAKPPPDEIGSVWAAAESAFQDGDLVTARHHATAIARHSRRHGMQRRLGHAQRLLGRIEQAWGDPTSAESAFRTALSAFTALEDGPAAARVLTEMAQLRLRSGDFAGATDLSLQAVTRAPGDVHALTALGYALWLGGSPSDGLSGFEQALYIGRDTVRALAGRGQINADTGDSRAALADLNRVLALGVDVEGDDEADVRSARALALAALGRLDDADAEMASALSLAPDRPRTLLRRARIHLESGRDDEAHTDLAKVLASATAPVETATARRLMRRLGHRR